MLGRKSKEGEPSIAIPMTAIDPTAASLMIVKTVLIVVSQ